MRAKYFSTRKTVFSELSDLSEGGTGASYVSSSRESLFSTLRSLLNCGMPTGNAV